MSEHTQIDVIFAKRKLRKNCLYFSNFVSNHHILLILKMYSSELVSYLMKIYLIVVRKLKFSGWLVGFKASLTGISKFNLELITKFYFEVSYLHINKKNLNCLSKVAVLWFSFSFYVGRCKLDYTLTNFIILVLLGWRY